MIKFKINIKDVMPEAFRPGIAGPTSNPCTLGISPTVFSQKPLPASARRISA